MPASHASQVARGCRSNDREQRAQVPAAAWCGHYTGPSWVTVGPGSLAPCLQQAKKNCQKYAAGNVIPLPKKRSLKITLACFEREGKFHTYCLLQVGFPKIKLLGLTASGHLSINLGNRLVKSQQTWREPLHFTYEIKISSPILTVHQQSLLGPQSSAPWGDVNFFQIKESFFCVSVFRFPHLELISFCILKYKILRLIKALLNVIC